MPEEVRVSPDGSRILVTSSGQPSLEEMKRTLAKLEELRRQHGIDRILVDSRARSSQPSMSEIFRGAELLAEKLGRRVRVAVLAGKPDADHEFFATTATNRGTAVRFFTSEDPALAWLARKDS